MAQEYEVTAFEASDFKDKNGNWWCNAAFLGVSEPVKWVVKDPAKFKVGDKVYGELKVMTSKAGKPYLRFYRQQPLEQQTYVSERSQTDKQTDEYWAERNDSIKAQFAIKTAVELLRDPAADVREDTIEHWANIFFNMVERIAKPEPYKDIVAPVMADKEAPINLDDIPF